MLPGMIYPNVTDAVRGLKKGSEEYKRKEEEALRARDLADLCTLTRGTHRQKTKIFFGDHESVLEAALLWGDRGQRRAAQKAKSLKARGYEAVP